MAISGGQVNAAAADHINQHDPGNAEEEGYRKTQEGGQRGDNHDTRHKEGDSGFARVSHALVRFRKAGQRYEELCERQ